MRRLSRERRLAVLAASLAAITAATSAVLTPNAHGLSDGVHGLVVGIPLGLSLLLLGVSATHLRRDRSACPRNPRAS